MRQENGLSPLEQVMPLCYKALGKKKGGGGRGWGVWFGFEFEGFGLQEKKLNDSLNQ